MRETVCCLRQTIIKLILLKLLTPPPDIKMTCLILIILISTKGLIYPTEFQFNKANSSDTESPVLDLNQSIMNGIVSSKIYDKGDDLILKCKNFQFLDGDVPCFPFYAVYISQLIRFARVCPKMLTSTVESYF